MKQIQKEEKSLYDRYGWRDIENQKNLHLSCDNGGGNIISKRLDIVGADYGATNMDKNWSSVAKYNLKGDGKLGIFDLSALARLLIGQ